jgi:hypothetical protein
MARNFPHVEVLGVDISPTPITVEQSPENLRFEIDDVNNGLDHFKNSFELVHMRCVGAGLPNYAQGIVPLFLILRSVYSHSAPISRLWVKIYG